MAGLGDVLFRSVTVMSATALILNGITLAALLLVGGSAARTVAINVSWLRIAWGILLILLGIWEVLTLNVWLGFFMVALGALIGVALGYWTIKVLIRVNFEASREQLQQGDRLKHITARTGRRTTSSMLISA